jgi:GNAT superfamily N-acetyltransferase
MINQPNPLRASHDPPAPGENLPFRFVEATGPADLDRVRSLLRAYAEEFAGSIAEALCHQGFESELASLPGRYAPPGGRLLLAINDTRAIGCVGLRDLGDGLCEMKRLYVPPDGRGLGVGRALVGEIIGWARRAGYARMRLDSTPGMVAALSLYRSLGFLEIPRYHEDAVHGAVYLELDLSSPGLPA